MEGEKHYLSGDKEYYFVFEDNVAVLCRGGGYRLAIKQAPKYGKTIAELKQEFIEMLPSVTKRRKL